MLMVAEQLFDLILLSNVIAGNVSYIRYLPNWFKTRQVNIIPLI